FFFSSRRRHTRSKRDWSSDVCSSDLYFRILLIPVFAWLYLQAETSQECFSAALVIGLSGLTDLFDGKIARKFNQVTELGKFLDPVADKLTLGVIIVCLATRYREIWLLAGLFLIKEGFMAVMEIGRAHV